jgi:hypothetical protein
MNHARMMRLVSELFERARMSRSLQQNKSCKKPGEWYQKYATEEEKQAVKNMTEKDHQNLSVP